MAFTVAVVRQLVKDSGRGLLSLSFPEEQRRLESGTAGVTF